MGSGYLYEVSVGNPAVDFNGFENYSMHVLRPKIIETDEPGLNMVSGIYQDKYKFILNNALIDVK